MEYIKHLIDQLVRDEDGQDMVEYALILGLISIIAVVAVTATGVSIQTLWNTISTGVAAA
jgi:Flp pilus assembly pilin Flp